MLSLIRYSLSLFLVLLAVGGIAVAQPDSKPAKVTPIMSEPLIGIKDREGLLVMVEYPPGGTSKPHRHNANVFVYVVEGSVVMQVAGGEKVTLHKGQTFYEKPDDIHVVSRNASNTEPARMLVFFVKEPGTPPTVSVN